MKTKKKKKKENLLGGLDLTPKPIYLEVLYLSEPKADISEYEYHRKECFKFPIPRVFIIDPRTNARLRLDNGVEIETNFKYFCSRCNEVLKYKAAGKWTNKPFCADVLLECKCGKWEGEGSPFSGSWYGSELTYTAFTKKEQIDKMNYEIKVIKDKYGY